MTAETHPIFGTDPAVATALIDDSAFRHAFGGHTTPWSDVVASTLDWCRAEAPTPQFSTRLVEATAQKVHA